MENKIDEVMSCKFDLIKILINNKSLSIKEFEDLREKLLLADKLRKSYYNKENINTEELDQIKEYLDSKSKKRR